MASMSENKRRLAAVRLADAVNKIEGVPVSARAKELSSRWAKGELSGAEMKSTLIAAHKRTPASDKHA